MSFHAPSFSWGKKLRSSRRGLRSGNSEVIRDQEKYKLDSLKSKLKAKLISDCSTTRLQ